MIQNLTFLEVQHPYQILTSYVHVRNEVLRPLEEGNNQDLQKFLSDPILFSKCPVKPDEIVKITNLALDFASCIEGLGHLERYQRWLKKIEEEKRKPHFNHKAVIVACTQKHIREFVQSSIRGFGKVFLKNTEINSIFSKLKRALRFSDFGKILSDISSKNCQKIIEEELFRPNIRNFGQSIYFRMESKILIRLVAMFIGVMGTYRNNNPTTYESYLLLLKKAKKESIEYCFHQRNNSDTGREVRSNSRYFWKKYRKEVIYASATG